MSGHRKVWWNNIVYYFLMMSWAAVEVEVKYTEDVWRYAATMAIFSFHFAIFCLLLFLSLRWMRLSENGVANGEREETKEYNVFCVLVLGRFHTFVPNSNSKSNLFMPIWTCRVCASCYRIWFGYAYLAHLSIHAETIRTMHGTAVHCPNEWIANASERCVVCLRLWLCVSVY